MKDEILNEIEALNKLFMGEFLICECERKKSFFVKWFQGFVKQIPIFSHSPHLIQAHNMGKTPLKPWEVYF